MKNSIKLAALILLASTGLFAATAANASVIPSHKAEVTFTTTPSAKGVDVKVEGNEPGKAVVIIYDMDGNVLRKDVLKDEKNMEKTYILNKLDEGDYTIEVTANGQVVKKNIHVYDEYQRKTFIILG